MVSKSQKVRLGIFIIVAITLLLVLLFMIVGKSFLKKTDTYYIAYKNVSVAGLNVGSSVQYHGLRIGRVEDLQIAPKDVTTVIVEINVKHNTPIKKDVTAVLAAVGITGLKQIELVGGDPKEENLKPNSYIKPGKSSLDIITGKAEVITEKAELVLNNIAKITSKENQDNLKEIIKNTKESITDLNQILKNNKDNFNSSLHNFVNISKELTVLIEALNKKSNDIDMKKINQTITNIDRTTSQVEKTINNLNYTFSESREDLVYTIQLMKETMQNLNEFSRLISEEPSILFKKRGYETFPGGGR